MNIHDLILIIVVLVVVGALMWAINVFLPLEGRIKQFLIGLIGFVAVVWALFQVLAMAGIQ
jgi:hypothetical protein